MNDVSPHPVPQADVMRIELLIEPGDPPLGTICAPGEAPVAFAGWLDLLGILSALAGAAPVMDGDGHKAVTE